MHFKKFTKYYELKLGREFLEDKSNNSHERLDTWNYQQNLFLRCVNMIYIGWVRKFSEVVCVGRDIYY